MGRLGREIDDGSRRLKVRISWERRRCRRGAYGWRCAGPHAIRSMMTSSVAELSAGDQWPAHEIVHKLVVTANYSCGISLTNQGNRMNDTLTRACHDRLPIV